MSQLQAVSITQQVSLVAAAELSAAATSVHPYSQRLWQQRLMLAQQQAQQGGGSGSSISITAGGAPPAEAIRREAAARGIRLP